jgi:ATP phosphoribosyltransferase regulatory subunit
MPDRWRRRLRHQFWRPDGFRAELRRLTTNPARSSESLPRALVEALDPNDPAGAESLVTEELDKLGFDVFGVRSLAEITEGMLALAADAKAKPLEQSKAAMIESYLEVKAYADRAPARLRALSDKPQGRFAAAIDAFERRGKLLKEGGVDLSDVPFSGEFGRNVAYYSGFVFEVLVLSLGAASPVAGGGRYDGLLRAVGAPRDIPAVGGAIHTERLLAVVGGNA